MPTRMEISSLPLELLVAKLLGLAKGVPMRSFLVGDIECSDVKLMQISLKCPNCGAALEVRESVSELACGYCGVQQIVQREGGGVWLSLERAMAEVKASADRAATEMTLRRLREEREELRSRLEDVCTRAAEADNQGFINFYVGGVLLVLLVGVAIIWTRIWDRDFFYSIGSGNLVVIGTAASVAMFGVMLGRARHRTRSIRDEAKADALVLEDQIAEHDRKIELQRRLVSVGD